LGESGSGKSASLRNMDPNKTLLVQAIAKPLPFKNDWKVFDKETKQGNIFVTDKATDILMLIQNTKRKIIVIDDFQYVMANEFMRRSEERGYDKFTEIGRNAWNILMMAAQLPPDVRVYMLSHSDTNDAGRVKLKTIGRMLDEKITVEGMFTIVMRCVVRDGEYYFTTKNNGSDTVKTPMDMFTEEVIDNDLAMVDARICDYYEIPQSGATAVKGATA
jgi:hypothetical protein